MAEPRTIPDDTMKLVALAFDAAWMASGAWNRNMTWEPAWEEFCKEHGLTECYASWKARNQPGTDTTANTEGVEP